LDTDTNFFPFLSFALLCFALLCFALIFLDLGKHAQLAAKKNALSLVKETVVLSGYKMFVLEKWLFNPAKFHKAVIFPSSNPDDKAIFRLSWI